jgi:hypothetical protein
MTVYVLYGEHTAFDFILGSFCDKDPNRESRGLGSSSYNWQRNTAENDRRKYNV